MRAKLLLDESSLYETIVSHYLDMLKKLLDQSSYYFEVSSNAVPKEPGVYVISGKKEKAVIYAGRTKNLRRRLLHDHKSGNVEGSRFRKALQQNFALNSEKEITNYALENCSFQFMVIERFEEMARLEHFITAVLAPVLNIQLKQ